MGGLRPCNWEESLDNVRMNVTTFTDSYCAWGACIETTLLIDLSEEERSSLAEHTLMCSACARRFRNYQILEEFAGELSQSNLFKYARSPLKRGRVHLLRMPEALSQKRGKWRICKAFHLLARSVVRLIAQLMDVCVIKERR